MNDPFAIGAQIGPYLILDKLGEGGMGAVYRARDPRLGRLVAIKAVIGGASDSNLLRRFEAEARAAGGLDHPNVLVVFDVGIESGVPYIVSELLEGETLRSYLRSSGLPVRQAVDFTVQIARGLAAAHAKGIIHRDLKPENLFVTRDGRVKILDFGIAKLASSVEGETRTALTGTGVIVGTAGYMAPEQVRAGTIDQRTDIFALGIVMHEMLSGDRPFRRDTMPETLTAILNDDVPELPATVPPAVARISQRCMEKRPDDRFHSAHDLALSLELLTKSTGVGKAPPARVAASMGEMSRRRALVYGASSLGLLAAGAAGNAWLGGKREAGGPPSLRRLTFRRGVIRTARAAPDGQTYIVGALWEGGACRLYTGRLDSSESNALELPDGNVQAISRSGEIALTLGPHNTGIFAYGTLARVPITGGAPRQMLEDVKFADWSPDGNDLAIIRNVKGNDQLEYPMGTALVSPKAEEGTGLGFSRVSPDGQRVAFVQYQNPQSLTGKLAVVDRSGKVATLTDQYRNIHGLAWKNDELWYSATDDAPLFRSIRMVTLSGVRRTVMRVPTNMTLWDVLPDGRILLAQTDDHGVMFVRGLRDGNDRNLSWLDSSLVRDISGDGQTILFIESGQGAGKAGAVSYFRKTDGAPAVRLGDGVGFALSPDGRQVLWSRTAEDGTSYMEIIPTGAGTAQRVPGEGIRYTNARWLPDGKRIVAAAVEPRQQTKLYLLEPGGAKPRPISPEGIGAWAVSPDGTMIAATGVDGTIHLYPLDGSSPQQLPGLSPGDSPIGWTTDGLLVMSGADRARGDIQKVDLRTGRKELWTNILPRDPAGILLLGRVVVTPDGSSLAYTWFRALSNLYVVEGLT